MPEGQETIDNPDRSASEDPIIDTIGSKLHDAWRETRRIHGTDQFEPRIKSTKDKVWISLHGGISEVDIANTPFDELPEDWKAENKAAATSAVLAIRESERKGNPLDDAFIESASAVQHIDWLSRNQNWAPQEQKLPYEKLPEAEKEKDRIVVRTAISVYKAR